MYSHAPEGYNCPFCRIVSQCADDAWLQQSAVIYHDPLVTALIPLHHFAGIKGNVIVVPNQHYENIFDIDYRLGAEIMRVVQRIAFAMKSAYVCEGISTRQHNEPAGNQDTWHYHEHVFPRFTGDNLYGGRKERYEPEERLYHAELLRKHIQMG